MAARPLNFPSVSHSPSALDHNLMQSTDNFLSNYDFEGLPESSLSSVVGSSAGTRPGSPSPSGLVLEVDGSGSSGLPTHFDLSSLFHQHPQTRPANYVPSSPSLPARMDFSDLNSMFGGVKGPGGDGQRDGHGSQQLHAANNSLGVPQNSAGQNQPQGNPAAMGNVNPNSVNLEALQQLLSMQMQMSMQYPSPSSAPTDSSNTSPLQNMSPSSVGSSPSAALIFEQQLRVQQLQQLQQLQNQIFQQQVRACTSHQSSPSDFVFGACWGLCPLA